MYKSNMQTRSQTRRIRAARILEWLRDFVLSEREPNAEDFLFASQVDTETLNQAVEQGPCKGKSVAGRNFSRTSHSST